MNARGAAQTCSPRTVFALISCAIENTDRTGPHACTANIQYVLRVRRKKIINKVHP